MKKKEKIRYDGARPLLVLPYVMTTSAALMYTICRDHMWICTAAMCVLACAVYMLVYHFRKRPLASAGVVLILVSVCNLAFVATGSVFAEKGFMDFMFTASTFFEPVYAVAAIVIFSVIIGFVCSYFSAIMPRECFLMLVAFIPLILSSRTAGGLPMWLLVPMFGSMVLAICGSAVRCPPQDVAVFRDDKSKPQRAAAAVVLAALSALAAMVIPKSSKTPMGDFLDEVFIQGDGYYQASEHLSNFVSRSSVNTGDNAPSNTLLFTVQTDAPMLIDRWVFDAYDGERGWYYLEDYNTGYAQWEGFESACRPVEFFNALRKAVNDGELEGYEQIGELPRELTDTQYMFIRVMDDSSTKVILHPLNTVEVEITDYSGGIYRTPKGELFTDNNIQSAEYLLTYHAEDVPLVYSEVLYGVDYEQLLYDAAANAVIDNSAYRALIDEHHRAQAYLARTSAEDKMSNELYLLALEITEDHQTDYEKACAIERWFGENGFVYDMDFVPRRAEADYFVFESKRGICSDFATAVTLMARAAGLPARYTEGFALSEEIRDENGVYNVTSANTHAYTQIYITGCGWVNFDATRFVPEAESGELSVKEIVVIVVVLAAAIVLIALAVIFRARLSWLIFSIVYPMYSESSAVKALTKRMRKLASELGEVKLASLSVGEAEEIIANRLNMGRQAAELRTAADELLYSGAEAHFDKKKLYRCMADILRQKRRMKR